LDPAVTNPGSGDRGIGGRPPIAPSARREVVRVDGRGLVAAATNLLRVGLLLVALLTLVLARADVPAPVLAAVAGISLGALYVLDRRRGGFVLFAAYVIGFVLFALLRTTADDTGIEVKGEYVLRAEQWLFDGTVPTAWLQSRLYDVGSTGLLDVACTGVYLSYFLVPQIVALVLWRRSPALFRPYAFAVLFIVYAGLIVSFLVPTAPPWLAAEYADGPPMARVVANVLGWNPEQAGGSGAAGANPFAAMPSLHFALTVLVVVALWRWRWLRPVALAYGAAMAFSLVYLGEHYVVDEAAGLAIAALGLVGARHLLRQRGPSNPRLSSIAVPPTDR
jgi:membrane-associated phospholipid phosphatase